MPAGEHPAAVAFDRATRLISSSLEAPLAVLALLDHDRHVLVGQHGLSVPWELGSDTTSLSALCQQVVDAGEPLAIADAREHPYLGELATALSSVELVAFAGVPIHSASGEVIGVLAAIDSRPRDWGDAELQFLSDLGALVAHANAAGADGHGDPTDTRGVAGARTDEFRLLVESVHDYEIYLLDAEGRIATWNPGAERNKGYSEAEVLGRHFSLFHTPEDVARGYPAHVLRVAAEEGRFEGEGWRVRKDGSRFWAEVVLTAVRDESGELIGFANLTHDLTERRRAEEALRRREERFRSLVAATAQIVWVTDEGGVPQVGGRSQWSEFTGQEASEAMSGGWLDAVHPEDRARAVDAWVEAVRSRTPYEVEQRVRRRDGEYRTFRVRAVPVFEPDGRIREWVGMHTDITERKRAEAERDFLAEASRALASSLDYEHTLGTIARLAVSRIADWCGVDLVEDSMVRRVAVAHADPEREALIQPFVQYRLDVDAPTGSPAVIRTGRPELYPEVPDTLIDTTIRSAEHRQILHTIGVRSVIVVPLLLRGEVLGAITLAAAESGRRYGPRDLELAEELARRAAIAVDHARLFREAEEARASLEQQAAELEFQLEELQNQAAQLEESQVELEMTSTELQHANTELAAAEAHYRRLVETSPDPVFVTDIEGRLTEVNAAAERILQRPEGELLGRRIDELIGPEDQGEAYRYFARVIAGEGEGRRLELRVLGPSGDRRIVELAATAVREDGTITGLHGVARDVTEERLAQEALQRSHDFYLSLFDRSPVLMWRADASGDCDFFNQTWLSFTGRTMDEELGHGWAAGIHPEDRERCLTTYHETIVARGRFESEYRLRHHSGEYRWVLDVGQPFYGLDGEFLGYIGAGVDVHEQRQLEERLRQAERMEAVGRLAGGIAHDFNNLIGVISGTAELILLDTPEPGTLREDIEEIVRAADRAAELTRRLLAFSRQQVLKPQLIDLNQIVQSTEKLLRRTLGEDIELAASLDPTLHRTLADPGQVEQILLNLAINARDAMPRGGRLVTETRNTVLSEGDVRHFPYRVRPGPYVVLAISDSGHGMSAEVASRVFEPFFTTKETGRGTGLGLSTVYGIVKQSRGYIWVESEPGHGTRFEIFLPQAAASGQAGALAEGRKSGAVELVPAAGARTVLVVEDEASLRVVARRALVRAGYRVLEADGGEGALRVLAEHTVDLLFTDVVMPRMSGRELAELARHYYPDVKVLYTSGHTDEAILHHQVRGAEVAFLPKPYRTEALLRMVADVLDGSRRER